MTVNAAPSAVPAYRRLGFKSTGEEKLVDGIRFVPMERPVEAQPPFRG
ncbi:GNAT family N-acetyltransferase [uncultured Bilophila sp.]